MFNVAKPNLDDRLESTNLGIRPNSRRTARGQKLLILAHAATNFKLSFVRRVCVCMRVCVRVRQERKSSSEKLAFRRNLIFTVAPRSRPFVKY